MKCSDELPAPVLPDHLAPLAREAELADAWKQHAMMRKAEAAAVESLLAYKARKLEEAKDRHTFHRRAVEKAVLQDAAVVLGMTTSAVRRFMESALFLQNTLPKTWEAYRTGVIDLSRATRAAQAAEDIAHRDDILPTFDAEAAEKTPGMNISEVDQWVKRRVPELDTEAYSARCERAKKNRYVAFTHRDDGMTRIHALLPTVSVVALERELQAEARTTVRGNRDAAAGGTAITQSSDPIDDSDDGGRLSLTQAMADAFSARLSAAPATTVPGATVPGRVGRTAERHELSGSDGENASGIPNQYSGSGPRAPINAKIGILVPAETLTGQGNDPAVSEDGSFVLPAAEARRIAQDPRADHDWYAAGTITSAQGEAEISAVLPLKSRSAAKGVTGGFGLSRDADLLTKTSPSRFAGGKLKEAVLLRDGQCRAQGCTRPAWSGEIDHRTPHEQGGATTAANLQTLCKEHHTVKSHGLLTMPGENASGHQHPPDERARPSGTSTWDEPPDWLSDQGPPPAWAVGSAATRTRDSTESLNGQQVPVQRH
ncbi:HNH endonuclease [Nesterenkonia muleiensis]|uniref:HNH endonuclease n=1 Tax=Nesterenkonia muleiensis TaxID=2282648 RepID=UPI000E73316A|nr:HNH endonuclease signature motif containing protein [Nesterenkonia muleiensis]